MSSFVRQHKGAVLLSVVLHVAVVVSLTLGLRLPGRQRAPVATQLAIEAVVVDESQLNREIERRERAEREVVQRRQREERQAREAVENQRRERAEAARREEARLVEIQLQRERTEREQRERAEAEKREQERVAQERREREQREQRERDAAAAARRQAETEAELQRALTAENERRAAEEAGLLDQYVRMIENQIERNWIPPATARAGLECVVNVVQIPSGDVIDVRVGRCNGDDAVVRSIEAAVRRASPLPKPPSMAVFERNLNVTFRPDL